jgi:hypothetical protein
MSNLRLCVIDDFYPDPQLVRRYALSLPYKEMEPSQEKTFYKGRLTGSQHPYSQMGLELIAQQLRKLVYWPTPTGEFRLIMDSLRLHGDALRGNPIFKRAVAMRRWNGVLSAS